jgi:rhamnose transport system substrate-binding protein
MRYSSRRFAVIYTFCMILLMLVTACGGTTPNAPAATTPISKKTVIAFVPQFINMGYFNAMQAGGSQAAKDAGVTFDYARPASADPAAQVQTIKQLIARHVDAIAVAPADPTTLGPVFQQAQSEGIKIFTTDTDAPNSVRSVFVNPAPDDQVGTATIDALASAMNKQGEWAINSCRSNDPHLNALMVIEKSRAARLYPNMKYMTTVYSGDSPTNAIADTKTLINGNPTLKGVLGQCMSATPGAAAAVTDLQKIGKVFVSGIGLPNDMRPFIKNGAVKSFVLWDPVKLGYLTTWTGVQLVEGKSFAATNAVPSVGNVNYNASQQALVLGPPITFDKSNIDQYHF